MFILTYRKLSLFAVAELNQDIDITSDSLNWRNIQYNALLHKMLGSIDNHRGAKRLLPNVALFILANHRKNDWKNAENDNKTRKKVHKWLGK